MALANARLGIDRLGRGDAVRGRNNGENRINLDIPAQNRGQTRVLT